MIFYYLLIFAIPFPEYRPFAGIVGELTLVRIVGIFTLIYAIYKHFGGLPYKFWPNIATKNWYIAFFAGLYLVHFSWKVWAEWSVHIALLYIGLVLIDKVEIVIKTFIVTIAGLLWNCIQSMKGIYIYKWYNRAEGSFGDANYFAIALLVGIAFTYCVSFIYTRYRVLLFGVMLLFVYVLMLTASRGGMVAFCVMCLLAIANSKRKILYFLIFIICVLVVAIAIKPDAILRFKGTDEAKESTELRIGQLLSGFHMIADHPLVGVGYGNFKSEVGRYNANMYGKSYVAHNTYLSIAAELGMPMLIIFIGLLVSTINDIRSIIKKSIPNSTIWKVAISLHMSFISYCSAILFLTAEREKYLWLMIVITVSIAKISSNCCVIHSKCEVG